jgi:hypothetical protein
MPDYNSEGVSRSHVEHFCNACEAFAGKHGPDAGRNWLIKLNPWYVDSRNAIKPAGSEAFTNLTVSTNKRRENFFRQPFPQPCRNCNAGVVWFRPSSRALVCTHCAVHTEMEEVEWWPSWV